MSKDSISQTHLMEDKTKYDRALHNVRNVIDRVALVTGADNPGSIGEAIAQHQDLSLYVYAPDKFDMDVRSAIQIQQYMRGKEMDALICCHGLTRMQWFEEMDVQDMQDIVDVNLIGSALVAREFVRQTLTLPWRKRIVFIGSMAATHVLNASAVYCASKAGLAMLTRCLAWELAPKGYDVICLHPSNTEGTPMTEETIRGIMQYRGISRWEAEDYWAAILPRARWLQPHDIAQWVVNFLNDPSGYLSGANVELGGGQR